MFCSTLRQRNDLNLLIPLLASSTNPILQETTLSTHDIAIPRPPQSTLPHQAPRPLKPQLFLILTPTSLRPPNLPPTLQRITRFSTLTATPPPTIAFILAPTASTSDGKQAYTRLQSLFDPHLPFLPTPLSPLPQSFHLPNKPLNRLLTHPSPPPLLPIPSPPSLLPILRTYTGSSTQTLPLASPQKSPLHLLPHVTVSAPARPLGVHAVNVLSDLCHSLKEVVEMCASEEGRGVLEEWMGREGKEVGEFWEEEWVCE